MLLMDFRLSLVAFTGVPLIVIITFSLKRVIKRNFKNMKTIIGQINGFFAENVAVCVSCKASTVRWKNSRSFVT